MISARVTVVSALIGAAVLAGYGGGTDDPTPRGIETTTLVSWEKITTASASWDTTGSNGQPRWGCPTAGPVRRLCRVIAPGLVNLHTGAMDGTGIVLNSAGLILTNNHVIRGAGGQLIAQATTTGQTWRAWVVATDPDHDVALIQLDSATGLHPATLDWTDPPWVGQRVAVAGNAEGNGGYPVVSLGTVTGVNVPMTITDQQHSSLRTGMIQIQADVEPGESGGPLITRDGQVIGLITATNTQHMIGAVLPLTNAAHALSASAGITINPRDPY